ncbi:GNAT family N-acetyltransferase [Labrys wisconsinensis]|uniref:CelD/BcsL family acetyltransferase involved in cellulose biosynthesis n=1 Tax=Labrys wisconsinensis TaxID=425677 RepID=A0ABU0J3Q1_9HYPH|nr:GNAT family N-acetyltransferase [Labrys wisconsinensis]MDQ0468166.1 CelD/BcsL family acetyltransferase involved in cellulose biosynthesis [Labrys wisconsinensis]
MSHTLRSAPAAFEGIALRGRAGAPAGVEARPSAGYAVERLGLADLGRLAPAWDALTARALESNPFLSHGFVSASLADLADARGCEVAAVWRTDAVETMLVGLWAFAPASRRWGLPFGLAEGMTHNYAPLGVPLLDRDHGREAAAALLDWLGRRPVAARFALFAFLPEEGAAARVLAEAMAARGLRHQVLRRHRRAFALPRGDGDYVEQAVAPRKRKELARQHRRLAEMGALTAEIAITPEEVAAAVEAFLQLELEGWKGRDARTATLQRADRAAFLRAAAGAMARDGAMRVHLLKLDGRAIAAGIGLVGGDRAIFWKVAYDERHAKLSPGVQVALAVTRDLLAQPSVAAIDSVAEPGHPMIDHLWRERLGVADWLVDLRPGGSWRLRLALALERARSEARIAAKAVLARLRLR